MEKAIKRLKELADTNTEFVNKLENGEVDLPEDWPIWKTEGFIRTYRFWSMCLATAAYLLENDIPGENT